MINTSETQSFHFNSRKFQGITIEERLNSRILQYPYIHSGTPKNNSVRNML